MKLRLSDRETRSASSGILVGLLFIAIGVVWLIYVLRAEHRSSVIQRGVHATAVIDERKLLHVCFHFTCNQTEYSVRYLAEGRVWRARVLTDGWDRDHPVGSQIEVVYEPADPGLVEIAGGAPSPTLPTIGATIALVAGTLLVLLWTSVAIRRRRADG